MNCCAIRLLSPLQFTRSCVLILLNLYLCQCFNDNRITQLIADVPVHNGYEIKYSFKNQHYIDIAIIPNSKLNDWLALTLEKSVSGGKKVVLQTYNGKDFNYIQNDNSYTDISNCNKIISFVYNDIIFLIISKCDSNTSKTDIIVVDDERLSLSKLQTLPHSVEDAQFWKNMLTSELNLVVTTRQTPRSRKPGFIYLYVYNEASNKFEKADTVQSTDPRDVIVFEIESNTFLAVASFQDLTGDFAKSDIFIQDNGTNKLRKYQQILSKGAISFTYFCYIGETKFEHFLIAANNKRLKGPSENKKHFMDNHSTEESLLYKWNDGYFVPFQTLMVRLPSPWIMVPTDSNVLILVTWSYTDGLVSYQYDGWRFRSTTLHQMDNTTEYPNFSLLQSVSIAGETLFTIITPKGGAKRKYFIVPTFKKNARTRTMYNEKEKWCQRAYHELQLAWNQFKPHYYYLSELNNTRHNSPKERITALLDMIVGSGEPTTGIRKRNNELEVMSLQGSSSIPTMQAKSNMYLECEVESKLTTLPGVTHIAPLDIGFLCFKQPDIIMFYPISQWKKYRDPLLGNELYQLNIKLKITNFQTIKLCKHQGLYIEGFQDGILLGYVYIINNNLKISLHNILKLKASSNVKSMCIKKNRDCFVIIPTEEGISCSIRCGNATKYFACETNSKVETINRKNHDIAVIISGNTVFQFIINDKNQMFKKNETFNNIKKSSRILMDASGKQLEILLLNEDETQICRLQEDLRKKITCKKASFIPSGYKHIKLALINKELVLLTGTKKSIAMNVISNNSVMIVNNLEKISYNDFNFFAVNNYNFLTLHKNTDSTIIEFELCSPPQ